MQIRTQTILVITPIFAVLGVAIGLVVYASEKSEVMWGVEQEVNSLAITVAEFTDGDELVRRFGAGSMPEFQKMAGPLISHDRFHRARLFMLAIDPILIEELGGDDSDLALAPNPLEIHLVRLSGDHLSTAAPDASGRRAVKGLAAVRNSGGDIVGLVEVIGETGGAQEQVEHPLWHCLELGGALFAVGLILSIGVSGFLTRRIKRLEQAARIVASGDYDHQIERRSIREINDLGSTFNTMSSVLRDVVAKAKKSLVDGELYRNTDDLTATFREMDEPGLRYRICDYEILFTNAGNLPSGAFSGSFEKDGATCFIVGAVRETDPLRATIKANAALHFILSLLNSQAPAATLQRAEETFELRHCAVVEHRAGESLIGWQAGDQLLPATDLDCAEVAPLVITTAGAPEAERVRRFINSTGNMTSPELDLLMNGQPLAAFLIIQRFERDPSSSPAAGPARYRNRRVIL